MLQKHILLLSFPLISGIFILLPAIAYAAGLGDIIAKIFNLVSLLIPVVVALALLFFFWGLAKFILNSDNEQKRSEGKQLMVWGIIALFVMISVWGLVFVLQQTFSIQNVTPPIPQIPGSSRTGLIDLTF